MTRSSDSARVYAGLLDLFERRLNILLGKSGPHWRRMVGPVYDPTQGSGGDGWPCAKCRRTMRSDRRVCGSCGYINR